MMSRRPLWPPWPPPCLKRGDAGRHVEFVVGNQNRFGGILKNVASAATAWPLRFMKVVGISSRMSRP